MIFWGYPHLRKPPAVCQETTRCLPALFPPGAVASGWRWSRGPTNRRAPQRTVEARCSWGCQPCLFAERLCMTVSGEARGWVIVFGLKTRDSSLSSCWELRFWNHFKTLQLLTCRTVIQSPIPNQGDVEGQPSHHVKREIIWYNFKHYNSWLVVGPPLWKILVNWDDYSQYMGK